MTDNNNKKQLYVTGSANAVRTAAHPAASKLLSQVCAVYQILPSFLHSIVTSHLHRGGCSHGSLLTIYFAD